MLLAIRPNQGEMEGGINELSRSRGMNIGLLTAALILGGAGVSLGAQSVDYAHAKETAPQEQFMEKPESALEHYLKKAAELIGPRAAHAGGPGHEYNGAVPTEPVL